MLLLREAAEFPFRCARHEEKLTGQHAPNGGSPALASPRETTTERNGSRKTLAERIADSVCFG
jgi:hypothetical protein